VSFLHHECLVVPFWFDDESDARNYAEKANGRENREFLILQEFTYKDKTVLSEAKIVGVLTCPGYPSFEESDTERRPGVWAHVRTIFVCDRGAAKDYLTRFNEDCAAAYEINQKMITQRLPLGKAYTSRTSPGGFCLPRRWRTR
jgi:hypothetical protein